MVPEKKNQTEHGVLALLVVLCLLMLLLSMWPLLFLLMLGLFGYGLWALANKQKQPAVQEQTASNVLRPQPVPISEQDLITLAFGLLQRRITEQLTAVYPHAKWVWSQPGARERFATGGPLIILLNGAAGYQKATVQVSDLKFYSLFYLPQNGVPVSDQNQPELSDEETLPTPVDYGLLAFEWVEANLQRIYALNNEAAANGQSEFRIPAEELLRGDSWPAVCAELVRNGFPAAEPVADGIQIQINHQREENE